MSYLEFKSELIKQININSKYFKPKEVSILFDFVATINEMDFKKSIDNKPANETTESEFDAPGF